jgi:hypothetical protein
MLLAGIHSLNLHDLPMVKLDADTPSVPLRYATTATRRARRQHSGMTAG